MQDPFLAIVCCLVGFGFALAGILLWKQPEEHTGLLGPLGEAVYSRLSEGEKKRYCAVTGCSYLAPGAGLALSGAGYGFTGSVRWFGFFGVGLLIWLILAIYAWRTF